MSWRRPPPPAGACFAVYGSISRPSKCLPMPPCRERFELALASPAANEADGEAAGSGERYRFSRCTRPLPAALMAKLGVSWALVSRGLMSRARTHSWLVLGLAGRWHSARRAAVERTATPVPCCVAGAAARGGAQRAARGPVLGGDPGGCWLYSSAFAWPSACTPVTERSFCDADTHQQWGVLHDLHFSALTCQLASNLSCRSGAPTASACAARCSRWCASTSCPRPASSSRAAGGGGCALRGHLPASSSEQQQAPCGGPNSRRLAWPPRRRAALQLGGLPTAQAGGLLTADWRRQVCSGRRNPHFPGF